MGTVGSVLGFNRRGRRKKKGAKKRSLSPKKASSVGYLVQRGADPLGAGQMMKALEVRDRSFRSRRLHLLGVGLKEGKASEAKKMRDYLRDVVEKLRQRGDAFVHDFALGKKLGFTLTLAKYDATGRRGVVVTSTSPQCELFPTVFLTSSKLTTLKPGDELFGIDDDIVTFDKKEDLKADRATFDALQRKLVGSGGQGGGGDKNDSRKKQPPTKAAAARSSSLKLLFLKGAHRDALFDEQQERAAMAKEDPAALTRSHRARVQALANIAKGAASVAGEEQRKTSSAKERVDAVALAHRAARQATTLAKEAHRAKSSSAKDCDLLAQEARDHAENALLSALSVVCDVLLEKGATAAKAAKSARDETDLAVRRKDLVKHHRDDHLRGLLWLPSASSKSSSSKSSSSSRSATHNNNEDLFEVGATVRVSGLRKASDFNDRVGRVSRVDRDARRCVVNFADGSIVSVRSTNLYPATSAEDDDCDVGSRIAITGLRSQLTFNGVEGVVADFDRDTRRYLVETDDGHQVALKPANVELLSKQTSSPHAFHASLKTKAKRAVKAAKDAIEANRQLCKWVAALNAAANDRETGDEDRSRSKTSHRDAYGSPDSPGSQDLIERTVALVGVTDWPELNGARCQVCAYNARKRHFCVRTATGKGPMYAVAKSMVVPLDRGGDLAVHSHETMLDAKREAKAAKEATSQATQDLLDKCGGDAASSQGSSSLEGITDDQPERPASENSHDVDEAWNVHAYHLRSPPGSSTYSDLDDDSDDDLEVASLDDVAILPLDLGGDSAVGDSTVCSSPTARFEPLQRDPPAESANNYAARTTNDDDVAADLLVEPRIDEEDDDDDDDDGTAPIHALELAEPPPRPLNDDDDVIEEDGHDVAYPIVREDLEKEEPPAVVSDEDNSFEEPPPAELANRVTEEGTAVDDDQDQPLVDQLQEEPGASSEQCERAPSSDQCERAPSSEQCERASSEQDSASASASSGGALVNDDEYEEDLGMLGEERPSQVGSEPNDELMITPADGDVDDGLPRVDAASSSSVLVASSTTTTGFLTTFDDDMSVSTLSAPSERAFRNSLGRRRRSSGSDSLSQYLNAQHQPTNELLQHPLFKRPPPAGESADDDSSKDEGLVDPRFSAATTAALSERRSLRTSSRQSSKSDVVADYDDSDDDAVPQSSRGKPPRRGPPPEVTRASPVVDVMAEVTRTAEAHQVVDVIDDDSGDDYSVDPQNAYGCFALPTAATTATKTRKTTVSVKRISETLSDDGTLDDDLLPAIPVTKLQNHPAGTAGTDDDVDASYVDSITRSLFGWVS